MKKIIFLGALFIALTLNAQYRTIGVGVNGGIPIGNLEGTHSVGFGLDLNYMYEITDQIELGATTGLVFISGKETNGVKAENKMYVPIAASVRFNNDFRFYVGGDFGYAIGLSPSGDRGGFYFKPMLGYNITKNFSLNVFYTGIKKEQPTFSYAGLGAMIKL